MTPSKKKNWKGYSSKWTGQFAAAAELTRRGYLVALTLGNSPDFDLLCHHVEGGASFGVQVKAQGSKSYFPISDLQSGKDDDVLILVYIPARHDEQLEFFIATRAEFREAKNTYQPKRRLAEGQEYAKFSDGVSYQAVKPFQNRWDKVPSTNKET